MAPKGWPPITASSTRIARAASLASAVNSSKITARGSLFIETSQAKAVIVPNINFDATPPLLVDLTTYQIIARLDAHMSVVHRAEWIGTSEILTAGNDHEVCRWAPSGQRLQCYQGGSTTFMRANVLPAGIVVAGDQEGQLWFWDRDTGGQLWKLQALTPDTPIVAIHVEPDGDGIVTFGLNGEVSRTRLPK